MADIARPDIEPDGQIIRVDINLVYAEEQVRPEEDFPRKISSMVCLIHLRNYRDAYPASLLSS